MDSPPTTGYQLLDSGEGRKLEQFGERTVIRPSTLAVWKRRHPELWQSSDGEYLHDEGWRFSHGEIAQWRCQVMEISLVLRPQRNGQVGIFPEHMSYLPELVALAARAAEPLKVLNLFAYTGMATTLLTKHGADVTHIDLLKASLDWTRENLAANALLERPVRLIPEEALVFLDRESKRGRSYDLIILDPPGFSRIAKNESWKIEDILPELLSKVTRLLTPGGSVYFTCHDTEYGALIVENLFRDLIGDSHAISSAPLAIKEAHTDRKLPAGYLVRATGSRS